MAEEIYIDQQLINDFFAEYEDSQDAIKNSVRQLEDKPDFPDALNAIFRNVHSLKSNLRMLGQQRLSDMLHKLENILDNVRKGKLKVEKPLLHLITIVVSEVKYFSGFTLSGSIEESVISPMEQGLNNLCEQGQNRFYQENKEIFGTIFLYGDYEFDFSPEDFTTTSAPVKIITTAYPGEEIINQNPDLIFFRSLIERIESFMPFWKERSRTMLDLLLRINERSTHKVDEIQLIAAVFMHDIGMGFIAPYITHKAFELNAEETLIMQEHVRTGAELLRRIPGWEMAAQMVAQHHERPDGTGYPDKLSADQICIGARLLAIGDAYWALTHDSMYVYKKKPVINALMEINKKVETSFDENLVGIFNDVVRELKSDG